MGLGSRIVNLLVVVFALFFVFLGLSFLYFAATGSQLSGSRVAIEGGPGLAKAALGIVFFLAAAPMFYYVFHPSAKGLPPAHKRPKPPFG